MSSVGNVSFNANVKDVKSVQYATANPSSSATQHGSDKAAGVNTVKNNDKESKKGFSFKKATNIAGVAAWLLVVGYSAKKLKLFNSKSPERITDAAKNLKKRALNYSENAVGSNVKDIDKALDGKKYKGIRKACFNMGNTFRNWEMRLGSELFNNLTYAFGTLVVMPLVVIFSPFGKKKSSKEDKTFAVLRQPLSVAATLGMQLTFDKMLGKYIPEVIKTNKMENASILDKDGKIKLIDKNGKFIHENYEKIKYNADEAKNGFKTLAREVLTEDEIANELFKNRSFEEDSASLFKGKLKDILNRKYEGLNINSFDDIGAKEGAFAEFKKKNTKIAEKLEKLSARFNKYASVMDSNKMAITRPKTIVNVVAASIIGCTFLNVIYGKAMKAYKKNKEAKAAPMENAQSNVLSYEKEVK